MRIGVISDTHGVVPTWEKAVKLFADANLILHAGDVLYHPPRLALAPGYDLPALANLINSCPVPIIIAKGNCDPQVYEEILHVPVLPVAFLQLYGLRIILRHGHDLDPQDVEKTAANFRADVLITGHTHQYHAKKVGNTIHLNPGSPAYPKSEEHAVPIPTVGFITESKACVLNLLTGKEIVSLPLLSKNNR